MISRYVIVNTLEWYSCLRLRRLERRNETKNKTSWSFPVRYVYIWITWEEKEKTKKKKKKQKKKQWKKFTTNEERDRKRIRRKVKSCKLIVQRLNCHVVWFYSLGVKTPNTYLWTDSNVDYFISPYHHQHHRLLTFTFSFSLSLFSLSEFSCFLDSWSRLQIINIFLLPIIPILSLIQCFISREYILIKALLPNINTGPTQK